MYSQKTSIQIVEFPVKKCIEKSEFANETLKDA